MTVLYGIHEPLPGDVRLVFESVTGMQGLWGGEDQILRFYSHSCPRLYELNTIAYWLMEKQAHSKTLMARINQVAQVAIELAVKRGNTSLTVLKAEKRKLQTLNKPYYYWVDDDQVAFAPRRGVAGRIDLGRRLKDLRTTRGLSQTQLAKQVGVTPSTISQVESNLIYPSLPALFKMAETLSVSPAALFQKAGRDEAPGSFSRHRGGVPCDCRTCRKAACRCTMYTPVDSRQGHPVPDRNPTRDSLAGSLSDSPRGGRRLPADRQPAISGRPRSTTRPTPAM